MRFLLDPTLQFIFYVKSAEVNSQKLRFSDLKNYLILIPICFLLPIK